MKILAHRGLWKEVGEKNSIDAMKRAFEHGFGIETDVRDYEEKLVVSHNVATKDCYLFEEVLKVYRETECIAPLAINIKADGIQKLLQSDLDKFDIQSGFVFDMSIPEQVVYHSENFEVFTRMSDFETSPVLLERSCGVWMDEWESSWINAAVITEMLDKGKKISVISPEIHGRDKTGLWKELEKFIGEDRVMLCTDVPLEAEDYFK